MELPKLFTFICFGIWAVASLSTFLIAALKPELANIYSGRRMKAGNIFDLSMMIALGAWLAMWCFRSMY
jgi:hypothetical protein